MNKTSAITLINKSYTTDAIGQKVATTTTTSVIAYVRSVSQSEFVNAGQIGFKPDKVFDVWAHEYSDQEELVYDGNTYSVYRTYLREDGRMELYTERRTGDAL